MNKKGGLKLSPLQLPSNDDQAQQLIQSVWVTIKPASHGIGVVAIRDIKKGDFCHCLPWIQPFWYTIPYSVLKNKLEIYPEILALIIERQPNVINGERFMSPNYDQRLLSFMNHSDTPNYDPATDKALADIKAGEELFEDYRTVKDYQKIYPFIDGV